MEEKLILMPTWGFIWRQTTVKFSQNIYMYERNLNGITKITGDMMSQIDIFATKWINLIPGMGYI